MTSHYTSDTSQTIVLALGARRWRARLHYRGGWATLGRDRTRRTLEEALHVLHALVECGWVVV